MNDKEVRVLELDKYEYGIVVNALNEFRNKVLRILDAPQKKRMFPRKYEEAR